MEVLLEALGNPVMLQKARMEFQELDCAAQIQNQNNMLQQQQQQLRAELQRLEVGW